MKRKRILFELIICLLAATAFISCSGNGNSSDSKNDDNDFSTENMILEQIKSEDSVCKAGHSKQINVIINSDNSSAISNVPVSIIFVKKTENKDSNKAVKEEQFYAGTYLIDKVTPGSATYKLNIIVPDIGTDYSSFTILGMFYYNLCNIYNGKENISDDDESAIVEDGAITESEEIKLDPSLVDQPDLMIENAVLSSDIMTLLYNSIEVTGTKNPLSISYDVQVLAKDISDAKVKFYLKTLDGKKTWPMIIKNSENTSELSIPPLTKYEKQTITTELSFSEQALSDLVEIARNSPEKQHPFYIEVAASSSSELPEFITTNNKTIANLYVNPDGSILPEETHKKEKGSSYSKFYGNSYFGAGFSYSAYTGIDRNKVYSENSAKLPIHLFKQDGNFFHLKFSFRSYHGNKTPGLEPGIHIKASGLDPRFLPVFKDYNFFSWDTDEVLPEWKTDGVLSVSNDIIPSLNNATQNSNKSLSFSVFKNDFAPQGGDCYISKTFAYVMRTMIGPIPVEMGFTFTGGAGFGAFAGAQTNSAVVGFVPYFTAVVSVYGCVGFKAAVSTGVDGTLDLIQGEFKNVIWITWTNEYDPDHENKVNLNATFNSYSGISVNMLRGSVSAFVTYPWPVFKKKHGIRYFAGFENKTARKYFWQANNWAISDDYAISPKKSEVVLIPLDRE